MQQFRWTKAHSVFLPQVDAEHRNLFRLAEDLHHSLEGAARPSRIESDMRVLIDAIEEHFAQEERMMKSAACQSYQWHKQQHDTVRKKAKQFLKEFGRGDKAAPETFLSFLARWFRDHVAVSDRLMGAQVRNRVRGYANVS